MSYCLYSLLLLIQAIGMSSSLVPPSSLPPLPDPLDPYFFLSFPELESFKELFDPENDPGGMMQIVGCDSRTYAQRGSILECPPPPPPIAPQDEASASDSPPTPTQYSVDKSYYDLYQYLSIESSYDDQIIAEIQPLQITPSKDEIILCGTYWGRQPPQGFDGSQFTHCYPLSAVGRLQIYLKENNEIATCTGAVIGAHTVLTAAHCFLQDTTNVEFTPGQFGQYKPFGSFQNGTVFKSEKKFDRKTGENDYVLVKFSEDIGALTGWLGVEYLRCDNLQGKEQYDLMVAGYADDKSDKMWTAECDDTLIDSCNESGQFAHVCDTLGGTSGAPLIENNMVVGIHSGAQKVLEENIATYITLEIMDFISTYIS